MFCQEPIVASFSLKGERRVILLAPGNTTSAFCLTGGEGKENTVRQVWVLVCVMDSVFSEIGSCGDWDVKILLLFAAVFIRTADYFKYCRLASFPPGPRAFPIVGDIFTVDHSRTHESLTQVNPPILKVYHTHTGKLSEYTVWYIAFFPPVSVIVCVGFWNFFSRFGDSLLTLSWACCILKVQTHFTDHIFIHLSK